MKKAQNYGVKCSLHHGILCKNRNFIPMHLTRVYGNNNSKGKATASYAKII